MPLSFRSLKTQKNDVVLDNGGKSREKLVELLASTPPEEILEKLKKQVEKKLKARNKKYILDKLSYCLKMERLLKYT